MTMTDEADAKKVAAMQTANQRGDQSVMVAGLVGRTQGFDLYADHQVAKHTVGTITGALIAKAGTAQAVGSTSIVVTTAASTGAFALKAGDSLTIGSNVYVVAADVTEASASTDETITLVYGLKTALAGSEVVTLTTGIGTCYQDMAGDMTGIGMVARLPETNILGINTVGDHMPIVDEVTGFPLLLSFYQQYHQVMFQVSALYGVAIMDEDKLVRVQTHA